MGSSGSGGGRRAHRDPHRGRRHDAPHLRDGSVSRSDRIEVPEPVDRSSARDPVPRQHPLSAERRGMGQHVLHLYQAGRIRGPNQGNSFFLLQLMIKCQIKGTILVKFCKQGTNYNDIQGLLVNFVDEVGDPLLFQTVFDFCALSR
jgi:hypothetical protein